jgi:hypothetical protein
MLSENVKSSFARICPLFKFEEVLNMVGTIQRELQSKQNLKKQ